MIGPPYKAMAERYGKDESAIKLLSEKIVKGGGGNWGQLPMPPQPSVSPEEAEALVKWICPSNKGVEIAKSAVSSG